MDILLPAFGEMSSNSLITQKVTNIIIPFPWGFILLNLNFKVLKILKTFHGEGTKMVSTSWRKIQSSAGSILPEGRRLRRGQRRVDKAVWFYVTVSSSYSPTLECSLNKKSPACLSCYLGIQIRITKPPQWWKDRMALW